MKKKRKEMVKGVLHFLLALVMVVDSSNRHCHHKYERHVIFKLKRSAKKEVLVKILPFFFLSKLWSLESTMKNSSEKRKPKKKSCLPLRGLHSTNPTHLTKTFFFPPFLLLFVFTQFFQSHMKDSSLTFLPIHVYLAS